MKVLQEELRGRLQPEALPDKRRSRKCRRISPDMSRPRQLDETRALLRCNSCSERTSGSWALTPNIGRYVLPASTHSFACNSRTPGHSEEVGLRAQGAFWRAGRRV